VTRQPPIQLRGVSKRYVKHDDMPLLFTRALSWAKRTKTSELWALRDIDLTVERGECLGVIGHNGAGKSTLLRLLAGVTAPTSGTVAIRGRVAPLISVGVGFHDELTGRENVFLNGAIMGLDRAELVERFDDIVSFAQIGDFINTPVKFYSSGMFLRLGFAVAALADPDVLLIDEVLAVGDLAFQLKCLNRMTEIKERGAALVLVTHNLGAIRRMCDRTMVISHGRMTFMGETHEAISVFHELLGEHREPEAGPVDRKDLPTIVEGLEVLDSAGTGGDRFRVAMNVAFLEDVETAIGVKIVSELGATVYWDHTPFDETYRFKRGDRVRVEVAMDDRLAGGRYGVEIGMATPDGTAIAQLSQPIWFSVKASPPVAGFVDLAAEFAVRDLQRG